MDSKEVIHRLKSQSELFGDLLYLPKSAIVKVETGLDATMGKQPRVTSRKNLKTEIDFQSAPNLDSLYNLIHNCEACELYSQRNKFVFGVGNPNADVMLVGEGPGADEDIQGEPFVGRAGQLLNDILKAIHFQREEVYIANIVKCRPPKNRTPFPEEIDTCFPYLEKQIRLINPKFILCLGATAAAGLLKKKDTLGRMRQQVFQYGRGIQVMVTYHPAALLRNPNWKRDCWEDVKAFRKLYDNWKSKN